MVMLKNMAKVWSVRLSPSLLQTKTKNLDALLTPPTHPLEAAEEGGGSPWLRYSKLLCTTLTHVYMPMHLTFLTWGYRYVGASKAVVFTTFDITTATVQVAGICPDRVIV